MRSILFALVMCSIAGCKDKESTPAKTGSAPTPSGAAATNGAPVDICGAMTKDKLEPVIGTIKGEPHKRAAEGSLLGDCKWLTADGIASVLAHPSNEYDATVRAMHCTDVPGLGEKAATADTSLFVQPAGKPYFLQIMVMIRTGPGKIDEAKSEALARVALDALK